MHPYRHIQHYLGGQRPLTSSLLLPFSLYFISSAISLNLVKSTFWKPYTPLLCLPHSNPLSFSFWPSQQGFSWIRVANFLVVLNAACLFVCFNVLLLFFPCRLKEWNRSVIRLTFSWVLQNTVNANVGKKPHFNTHTYKDTFFIAYYTIITTDKPCSYPIPFLEFIFFIFI